MNGAGARAVRQTAGLGSQLWRSVTLRQTSSLYLSQGVALVLGFWVSLINTRLLGPADFGLLAATMAATEFVTLFMDFGFFSSGARVLALQRESPESQRRIIGALVLIALGLSLLASVLLWGQRCLQGAAP